MTHLQLVPAMPADAILAHTRECYHNAGHAVTEVYLGRSLSFTPRGCPDAGPFIIFGGIWAEARWATVQGPRLDMNEAMANAWQAHRDGDTEVYGNAAQQLDEYTQMLGFELFDRTWEAKWGRELEQLWPVIAAVAEQLMAGAVALTHEVEAALTALNLPADVWNPDNCWPAD